MSNGDLEKAVEFVIRQLVIAKNSEKPLDVSETLYKLDQIRGFEWFDDFIKKENLLELIK